MLRYCSFRSTLAISWLFLIWLLPMPARAQGWFGVLRGVTRDAASGKPLADTRVSVTSVDNASEQHTYSGKDGSFLFRVAPGKYEVLAAKEGFSKAVATYVVTEMVVNRFDLALKAEPAEADPQSVAATDDKLPKRGGGSGAPQLIAVSRPGETPAKPPSEASTSEVNNSEVNNTAAAPTPDLTANTAVSKQNTAVLKELESLRARIEQLEGQLNRSQASTLNTVPSDQAIGSASPSADHAALALASPPSAAGAAPVPPAQQAAVEPAATPAPAPVDMQTPFADWDWTWLNGNPRTTDSPLDSKYFTGEFRVDTHYGLDFNQPIDHSMGGSSEVFRSGEVQLEQISLGGDFHAGNVRGRLLTLFGMFAQTTPRNDASVSVGQWDARTSYRYLAEAWGGYHFNVNHGLNVDAGIFVSYVGLFSYYNFDNWAYQPSYVSSNTPWFFNGVRVQWFPTHHLKIEPWFINGWQAYNRFNGHPGVGGQLKWTPKPWLNIISNNYGVGNDNVGLPNRGRYHTDNSVEVKYFDQPKRDGIDKMAFSLTGDLGCETGDGVTCHGGKGGPKQAFLGWMGYNRFWFDHDRYAFTLGGGAINNPGRYLTLVLPINGADAVSGTPYFPAAPGSKFKAYDATATLDYMPVQYFTFRTEFGYRHANVPYFSGRHGLTPPGGNNGSPADFVCSNGSSSGASDLATAQAACGGAGNIWYPDLRHSQALLIFSILVKF